MAIRRVGASTTRGPVAGERRPSGNPHHRLPPMPSAVAHRPDAFGSTPGAAQTPETESPPPAGAIVTPAPEFKAGSNATDATTIARLTTDVAQVRVGGKSFTERVPPVDYYSILASAVADLAANTVAARGQIYDHARRVVYQRLAAIQPPLSSFATAREELLLDRAIEKIEAENLKRHPRVEIEDGTAATVEEFADEAPEGVAETDDTPEAPEIIAPPDLTPPPLVAANATRWAQAQQAHGIMLRTFGLVGVVAACVFGFWLATGRPNLTGERSMTRSFSQLLAKAPAGAVREQTPEPQAAAAEATPPEPAVTIAPSATGAQQAESTAMPVQDKPDPGIDIWFACRQANPNQTMLCPPGTSHGGAPSDRKSWIAAYSGLSDVTGLAAMPRPNDPATMTRNATARARFERALERAKADDIDRALADFTEAIKIDPRFAEAYLQRGQTRFKNGDVEGAIADFTRTIELDSRHAAAYRARGMAMHYRNQDDAAIADLSKAIEIGELEPNRLSAIDVFYARRSRAVLYDGKQLLYSELADLNAMIESYGGNPDLAANLRASYRDQGAASLMASIHRMRASVNLKRGNINGAVDDMSSAIQLDKPRTLQFTLERARILENAGLRTQAADDYARVLALSPNNSEAKAGLARVKARS